MEINNMQSVTHIDGVRLADDGSAVIAIDQTLLPNEIKYITLDARESMFEAIKLLRVRGAPAIGIAAGFCLYVLARRVQADNEAEFLDKLQKEADYLNASRPTAVNLSWALRRMMKVAKSTSGGIPAILSALEKECAAIRNEDIEMCRAISEYGLTLVKDGDGILTHCNAGPLATSRYGTALGPMFLAKERGINLRVFADETRPLLQGARLTSFELSRAGIDVTLICDNMASVVMKNGWINACFVGCDRIAANGDTANKIGTNTVAILAKHYGIPIYTLGPTSTIDMDCPTGDDIHIELRDPDEIKTLWYEKPMAPADVKCFNPSFDVTDHSLLAGIVTEKGICRPPFTDSLKKLFA